jgi:hypothetical protein
MSIPNEALKDILESATTLIDAEAALGGPPSQRLVLQIIHHIRNTAEAGLAPSKRQPHRRMRKARASTQSAGSLKRDGQSCLQGEM